MYIYVIRLKKMIAQCKLLPYFIKSIYVVTLEIKSNPSENKIFLLFVILLLLYQHHFSLYQVESSSRLT